MRKLSFGLGLTLWSYCLWRLSIHLYARTLIGVWFASLFLVAASLPSFSSPGTRQHHLRRGDFVIVVAVSLVFILINTLHMGSWYFTVIGDEYAFWQMAHMVARGDQINFFTQEGAYGIVPAASSYYQAAIMTVAGVNYYGWKLSMILIVAVSFPFLYFIAFRLFDRPVAIVSVVICAMSHYIWAYTRTGYSNIESLFPTLASVALAFAAIDTASPRRFYLAGVFAGFGFYTFYSSRMTIGLVIVLVLLARPRRIITRGLPPMLLGFVLTLTPLVVISRSRVVTDMLTRSVTAPDSRISI